MRLGTVAVVLAVGCAGTPGSRGSLGPSVQRGGAAPVPVERPLGELAVQVAPEPESLRAAMAAALDATAPDAPSVSAPAEELEPIGALVRDDAGDAAGSEAREQTAAGRLPPESIQRVVQQNAGRFRDCYQRALLRNAAVGGRVVVRFVIGPGGSVARAEERSASLADRAARQCVLRSFFELSFSNPAEQRIVVEYPLSFSRDGTRPLGTIPSARQVAEAPPPGFADAMRAGRRAQPPPPLVPPYVPRTRGASRSSCAAGDPMCADL